MVSSPGSLGEMMQKALKMGVGEMSRQTCAGFPFLRASTNTAVSGWSHPQVSSQRHVLHDFTAAGLTTNPQCSVFQQYPALRLLLDPVQWPPIGQRAHMWTAVQNTLADSTPPSCVTAVETEVDQQSLDLSTLDSNKILAEVKQNGFEKQDDVLAESGEAGFSSQWSVEVDEAAVDLPVSEKKRARRSRRQNAQSSQILELWERLRAQKLLSVNKELQHGQRSALRAWAAECKRARAEVAHQREIDIVASHMAEDQYKLEKRLESASAKLALKISRLESQVQCSEKELQARRLLALSPSGRRWRLQRVILKLWAAGCAESKRIGVSQKLRNSAKRRASRTSLPVFPPPLPSIVEATEAIESSSDSELQNYLVTGSPRASATSAVISEGHEICGCNQSWGCMHHQTYSKGVLLLHREKSKLVARGPPGLSLGVEAPLRDSHHFRAVPHR